MVESETCYFYESKWGFKESDKRQSTFSSPSLTSYISMDWSCWTDIFGLIVFNRLKLNKYIMKDFALFELIMVVNWFNYERIIHFLFLFIRFISFRMNLYVWYFSLLAKANLLKRIPANIFLSTENSFQTISFNLNWLNFPGTQFVVDSPNKTSDENFCRVCFNKLLLEGPFQICLKLISPLFDVFAYFFSVLKTGIVF